MRKSIIQLQLAHRMRYQICASNVVSFPPSYLCFYKYFLGGGVTLYFYSSIYVYSSKTTLINLTTEYKILLSPPPLNKYICMLVVSSVLGATEKLRHSNCNIMFVGYFYVSCIYIFGLFV